MARQKGLLRVEGTLDNLTFYKTKKDGHLVKTKGGVSASRIANDPAFARTRENGAEFAKSANAGKLMRDGLRTLALNVSDGRLVSRLTQLMSKIKNLDTVSPRGLRNIVEGLTTPEGKALLKGFDFNLHALLGRILFKAYTVDPNTGEIVIAGLEPSKDIAYPSGTTHINFTSGFANINFATGEVDLQLSNVQTLTLNAAAGAVTLTPAAVPTGTGTKLFLLKMEFFQNVNGQQYSLKNGAYNALRIVEIA